MNRASFVGEHDDWESPSIRTTCRRCWRPVLDAHLNGQSPTFVDEGADTLQGRRYKWLLFRGLVVERDEDGTALRMIGTHSDDGRSAGPRGTNRRPQPQRQTSWRSAPRICRRQRGGRGGQRGQVGLPANMSHELRTPMRHPQLRPARESRVATAGIEKLRAISTASGQRRPPDHAGRRSARSPSSRPARWCSIAGSPHLDVVARDVVSEFRRSFSPGIRIVLEDVANDGRMVCRSVSATTRGSVMAVRKPAVQCGQVHARGRTIHVRLGSGSFPDGRQAVVLGVSDEGAGIPPDELNSVFDKFVQSSRTPEPVPAEQDSGWQFVVKSSSPP